MATRFSQLSGVLLLVAALGASAESLPPLDHRAELAARYLISSQTDSGLFNYEYDFIAGKYTQDDNIVRQAGGAFALAEYYQATRNLAAKQAVLRAKRAFEEMSIVWGQGRLLAMDGTTSTAKSGASALALLAALLLELPGDDSAILGWRTGLLALQADDGGFASRPTTLKQSAYSNGEIWLALAHYHDRFPQDVEVARALTRADKRFLAFYNDSPDIGFFHWGVMAAAKRFKTTGEARFAEFAARQSALYLDQLRPRVSRSSNSCYSVEGLAAGAQAISGQRQYAQLYARVRQRIDREMQKNRQLQIPPGAERIDFAPGRFLRVPELPQFAGAFLNGRTRPQTRVDASQHCLSALLKEQSLSQALSLAPAAAD